VHEARPALAVGRPGGSGGGGVWGGAGGVTGTGGKHSFCVGASRELGHPQPRESDEYDVEAIVKYSL
jgi:hypothetical protein